MRIESLKAAKIKKKDVLWLNVPRKKLSLHGSCTTQVKTRCLVSVLVHVMEKGWNMRTKRQNNSLFDFWGAFKSTSTFLRWDVCFLFYSFFILFFCLLLCVLYWSEQKNVKWVINNCRSWFLKQIVIFPYIDSISDHCTFRIFSVLLTFFFSMCNFYRIFGAVLLIDAYVLSFTYLQWCWSSLI